MGSGGGAALKESRVYPLLAAPPAERVQRRCSQSQSKSAEKRDNGFEYLSSTGRRPDAPRRLQTAKNNQGSTNIAATNDLAMIKPTRDLPKAPPSTDGLASIDSGGFVSAAQQQDGSHSEYDTGCGGNQQ